MKNKKKGTIVRWVATTICVGAPLATTISQFPIWIAKSERATISGIFLVLAIICCIPFYRQIRDYFKSPSAWVVWTVLTVLFVAMQNIIDQMIIVGIVGIVSNLIGVGLYKLGDHLKEKPDESNKEESDNNESTDEPT